MMLQRRARLAQQQKQNQKQNDHNVFGFGNNNSNQNQKNNNMIINQKKKLNSHSKSKSKNQILSVSDYLKKRDYVGAITVLEFEQEDDYSNNNNKENVEQSLCIAFCAFQLGNFEKAQSIYMDLLASISNSNNLLDDEENDSQEDNNHIILESLLYLNLCCVYFHMGMLDEAFECMNLIKTDCLNVDSNDLKDRLLLHLHIAQSHTQQLQSRHDKNQDDSSRLKIEKLSEKLINTKNSSDPSDKHLFTENLLSVAAMHYHHNEYQKAIDIYKSILTNHSEYKALYVYIAMCYFQMDYYDVSIELLSSYDDSSDNSLLALNLKACNQYRLYNGDTAKMELFRGLVNHRSDDDNNDEVVNKENGEILDKIINNTDHNHNDTDNSINAVIQHNMVVFGDKNKAMQILPPLINTIPEARLNLAIYFLSLSTSDDDNKSNNIEKAKILLDEIQAPSKTCEYILKAILNVNILQQNENNDVDSSNNNKDFLDHLKKQAQEFFHHVGSSPNECDTIPGRQCMASYLFLKESYEEANVYFDSIKSYLKGDNNFNWNYGISLAQCGKYKLAQEYLLNVEEQDEEEMMSDSSLCYLSWLSKCYIMNGMANQALDLYKQKEETLLFPEQEEDDEEVSLSEQDESTLFQLLHLIANLSYHTGQFLSAAEAFHLLEIKFGNNIDIDDDDDDDMDSMEGEERESTSAPSTYWEAKRGACIGVFQQVIASSSSSSSSAGNTEENQMALNTILDILSQTKPNNPQINHIIQVMKEWMREHNV